MAYSQIVTIRYKPWLADEVGRVNQLNAFCDVFVILSEEIAIHGAKESNHH